MRALLVAGLVLGLFALPLPTEAQPAKLYRVGVLCLSQCDPNHAITLAFRRGLQEHGWIEGQNIVIEYRGAQGAAQQLPKLARTLVDAKPDVLLAPSPPTAVALRDATTTIPIIFAGVGDPVRSGFVVSLSRPGGNMTGLTGNTGPELDAKRLELIHEALSAVTRIGVLSEPASGPYHSQALEIIAAAARTRGIQLQRMDVRSSDEIRAAFSSSVADRVSGVIVLGSPLTFAHAAMIAELAMKHRVATISNQSIVPAPYLMSYAPDWADIYRRAAGYIDKVLRGAKPADLPVEQPTKLELIINLKTAKALGLTIPPSLLLRADQVIE
jgi:putative tryptophan/tyrosine transport system substrate-binding protein